MSRSLVNIVLAGALALTPSCSKIRGLWGDSDASQSNSGQTSANGAAAEGSENSMSDSYHETILRSVLIQAKRHGVTLPLEADGKTVAVTTGPEGKPTINLGFPGYQRPPGLDITYFFNGKPNKVTLTPDAAKCVSGLYTTNPDSTEPLDITSCFGKQAPGPTAASLAAGALADKTQGNGTNPYPDVKGAMTDDNGLHVRGKFSSDQDPVLSSGTTDVENPTIICSVVGPPGKPREPPTKVPEGCPYTIWKEFKRPNLQAMIDHAFNTVMRGKTINGVDTLTFTDAETGYKALAGKFMETYNTELETTIDGLLNPEVEIDSAKQKVNLPAFYATVRERHGSRVIGEKTVSTGYSIDGDDYTDNGKAIKNRVKIDYLSESAIRAGVRKKVGIAVKAIGLEFINTHFYHPVDVGDDGKPTRTPSPSVTIPTTNYPRATFVYAASEVNKIDKTNPLCQPQSIDLTPAKDGSCAVGSGSGCYNGVTPKTDDAK